MVKCTLNYYGKTVDVSEDTNTLDIIPELSRFSLTVEKVKNDKSST